MALTLTGMLVMAAGLCASLYHANRKYVEATTTDRLKALRESKSRQIEDYFDSIRNQAMTFSHDQMVIEAMSKFSSSFRQGVPESTSRANEEGLRSFYAEEFMPRLRDHTDDGPALSDFIPDNRLAVHWQSQYIVNNPHDVAHHADLERADDGTRYSAVHAQFHPTLREYREVFGYYDIFLIDAYTGDIVYTVEKEIDYATNLVEGPHADSNLGRLFREVSLLPSSDTVLLVDYDFYAPSHDLPASFIACPIFEGDEKIGVLAFQVSISQVNSIMTGNGNWFADGLGMSGEAFMVGEDETMRSLSRFFIEDEVPFLERITEQANSRHLINKMRKMRTTVLLNSTSTVATRKALAGAKGEHLALDYRGERVYTAYQLLDIDDVHWALVVQIDESEALASLDDQLTYALTTTLVFVLFMFPFVLWISRRLGSSVVTPPAHDELG